jgi:hypothetical protein
MEFEFGEEKIECTPDFEKLVASYSTEPQDWQSITSEMNGEMKDWVVAIRGFSEEEKQLTAATEYVMSIILWEGVEEGMDTEEEEELLDEIAAHYSLAVYSCLSNDVLDEVINTF